MYKNYYENLPEHWSKAKLKYISTKIVDGNHNPPLGIEKNTNYLMLSSQNIGDGEIINFQKVRYLTRDQFLIENKRTNIQIGDILFTSVGTIGRSCIYLGGYNICFQRSVSIITPLIKPSFLKYYLDSPKLQYYFISKASGTAQKGFYLNQLSNLMIGFPSFSEQQKIVDKINDLYSVITLI